MRRTHVRGLTKGTYQNFTGAIDVFSGVHKKLPELPKISRVDEVRARVKNQIKWRIKIEN